VKGHRHRCAPTRAFRLCPQKSTPTRPRSHPLSPVFHDILTPMSCHTSQFTTPIAVPCELTLEIQERTIVCIVDASAGPASRHFAQLGSGLPGTIIPVPCPPCLLACDELSHIIIHNIDHRTTRINIRYTGFNKRPRYRCPPNLLPQSSAQLSMCPQLPRTLGFHMSLPSTSPRTSQFIISTTTPRELTLDIQDATTHHGYGRPPTLLPQSFGYLSNRRVLVEPETPPDGSTSHAH